MANPTVLEVINLIQDSEGLLLEVDSDNEDESFRTPVQEVIVETEDKVFEDFEAIYQKSKSRWDKFEKKKLPDKIVEGFLAAEEKVPIEANRILINKLINLKSQLQNVLFKVRTEHQKNELELNKAKSYSNTGKSSADYQYGYYKCGAPFFKDALMYPAPCNEDYNRRKNVYKEFFPFDLPDSSLWKLRQKISLMNGVRKQMTEHLISEQIKSISSNAPKTRQTKGIMKNISSGVDLDKMSLSEICQNVKRNFPNFTINWEKVAFEELNDEHQAIECKGMWTSYLNPELKRDEWTSEENEALLSAAEANGYLNWEEIAKSVPKRSSLQCFLHFQVDFECLFAPVKWTPAEDELLLEKVKDCTKCGVIDWNRVSQAFKNRSRTQCYNRFHFAAHPDIKKGMFTTDENQIILDFVANFGEDFNRIPPGMLPGRTVVQIRSHYNNALKNGGKIFKWTPDEDEILMKFVQENGTGNWKKLADMLGTHSRIACRTRYLTIQKHLERPNANIRDVPIKAKKSRKNINLEDNEELQVQVREFEPSDSLFLRIRTEEPRLFNTFKFAYNLSTESFRQITEESPNFKLHSLIRILGADFTGYHKQNEGAFTQDHLKAIRKVNMNDMPEDLVNNIKKLTKTPNISFFIPPSYDTIIGLRSVSLRNYFKKEEVPALPKFDPDYVLKKDSRYDEALSLFKKRFFQLFYLPALLSKINVMDLSCKVKEEEEELNSRAEYSAVEFVLELQKKKELENKSKNLEDDEEEELEREYFCEDSETL